MHFYLLFSLSGGSNVVVMAETPGAVWIKKSSQGRKPWIEEATRQKVPRSVHLVVSGGLSGIRKRQTIILFKPF